MRSFGLIVAMAAVLGTSFSIKDPALANTAIIVVVILLAAGVIVNAQEEIILVLKKG